MKCPKCLNEMSELKNDDIAKFACLSCARMYRRELLKGEWERIRESCQSLKQYHVNAMMAVKEAKRNERSDGKGKVFKIPQKGQHTLQDLFDVRS